MHLAHYVLMQIGVSDAFTCLYHEQFKIHHLLILLSIPTNCTAVNCGSKKLSVAWLTIVAYHLFIHAGLQSNTHFHDMYLIYS